MQLTIFHELNEIKIREGQATYKKDLQQLVQLCIADIGIADLFPAATTKIHVFACANKESIQIELLSEEAYLETVEFYPARPELYEYYKSRVQLIKDIDLSATSWCSFNERFHLYDGLYYPSNKYAERSIESIIATGFQKELRSRIYRGDTSAANI